MMDNLDVMATKDKRVKKVSVDQGVLQEIL